RGQRVFIGADQFIYWQQFHPGKVVSPDVYVLPGVDPGIAFGCWKIWEDAVVPSFALEIVSPNDWMKDYRENPGLYNELGVRELVVFDPDYALHRSDRVRWQV